MQELPLVDARSPLWKATELVRCRRGQPAVDTAVRYDDQWFGSAYRNSLALCVLHTPRPQLTCAAVIPNTTFQDLGPAEPDDPITLGATTLCIRSGLIQIIRLALQADLPGSHSTSPKAIKVTVSCPGNSDRQTVDLTIPSRSHHARLWRILPVAVGPPWRLHPLILITYLAKPAKTSSKWPRVCGA